MNKKAKRDLTREIAEELDTFDDMFSVLIELLEEKGVFTEQEWESKMKSRIHKKDNKVLSYREIQFEETES